MSDQAFLKAAQGVADTSYSRAIEHVLTMAKQGQTMQQMLESVGMDHWENPTWEDVVYALAYVHRRLDMSLPKATPVKLNPPKDHPLTRKLARRDPPEAREQYATHAKKAPTPNAGKAMRKCLRHGGLFESSGPGERICPACKSAHRSEYMGSDLGGDYA
jgi:hypothetical protein